MPKKSASVVLASLKGFNLKMESEGDARIKRSLSARQESFEGRAAQAKLGMYLLASSFVAASLDSFFEHPEDTLALPSIGNLRPYFWHQLGFFTTC
jgi:hypothetical protein